MMQKSNVERLHDTLQEILDYVISVCEQNGLRYFLIYGTALGAYRHQGFIPWDDDLDMAMPREDYDKFVEIMKTNPSELYRLQNDETEEKYYFTFSKIRKQGTIFVESVAEGMYQDNGIFIDVFPLDYVTDKDAFSHKIKARVIKYLIHTIRYAGYKNAYKKKYSKMRHVIEHIVCLPAFILPKKWIVKVIKSLSKGKCKETDAKYLMEYIYRWAFPMDVYFPAKKQSFCGRECNIPRETEKYLSSIYGADFMQLPPEEKRRTHLPLEIKF